MYKKFIKHAKKIAKDFSVKKERPVLEGIYHFINGDLAATNSHVLYLGKAIHEKELLENEVITPGGKTLDLEYPEIERLIPDTANFTVTIAVDEFIKRIDIIHVAGRVSKQDTTMTYEGETITSFTDEVRAAYEMDVNIPEEYKFASNAQYWLDALRMFKDFGYSEVQLNIVGSLRPLTLISPDEKITALIMPVRSY